MCNDRAFLLLQRARARARSRSQQHCMLGRNSIGFTPPCAPQCASAELCMLTVVVIVRTHSASLLKVSTPTHAAYAAFKMRAYYVIAGLVLRARAASSNAPGTFPNQTCSHACVQQYEVIRSYDGALCMLIASRCKPAVTGDAV